MKAILKLLPLMALLMPMVSCGDDEPEESITNVTLLSQSIQEGAEVDAASTTQITLTYNVPVKLSFAANITLNDKKVEATSNATAIVIPVQLQEGTSYTLQVQAGSVVAVSNSKASAPSFTLKFKTPLADIPQTGNIPTKPLATAPEAVKLYHYLYKLYGKKVLSSVMANVNWNNECADKVYKLTGKYPAMNCYDFIHICYSGSWINYDDISPVQAWTNAGGLVQLMWHFNVPKTQGATDVTCTPGETTFRATNALKDGTWENRWFYQQMDKVVSVLLKLQQAGIAATWRPFHEAAGNATAKQQASWTNAWFWWGYDGADTYKKLWHTMFDYFKQKGVDNLIWVWTTQNYNGDSQQFAQDIDWYPGDQYVDIVGRDLYGEPAEANAREFQEVAVTYPTKMVALAECGQGNGNQPGLISQCQTAGALWSHFMVWYQGGQGSTETMCSDAWWQDAMSCPDVITRDEVPNLKQIYTQQ